VIQNQDYYPFGLTFGNYSRENSLNNQYQYNGKEQQDELNLGWLDYGARMYQSDIGRWGVVDPHSYDYSNFSPYTYALSNPVNVVDPTGRDAIYTVARNKKGEITGLNISSTVYITGEGTSSEMADALTAGAAATFREKTVDGVTISFNVTYKHDADGGNRKLGKGENLLTFHNTDGRSAVIGGRREYRDGNNNITRIERITGNKGNMYKDKNGEITRGTVMHETLHFLGLSDRYSDSFNEEGNLVSIPHAGFESDIMGRSSSLRVGETHYRLYGKFFSTTTQNSGVINRNIDVDSRGNLLPPTLDELLKFVPTPMVNR
jgi:RHS repeat-associated protein